MYFACRGKVCHAICLTRSHSQQDAGLPAGQVEDHKDFLPHRCPSIKYVGQFQSERMANP